MRIDPTDRVVHARSKSGDEIVRYDKAGKWWLERADGTRAPLKLPTAVSEAIEFSKTGGTIFENRYGGTMFEAKVRKARANGA